MKKKKTVSENRPVKEVPKNYCCCRSGLLEGFYEKTVTENGTCCLAIYDFVKKNLAKFV